MVQLPFNSAGKVIFNGGAIAAQVGGSGWASGDVDNLLASATKTSGALGIDTTNGNLTQWTPFTTTNLGSALGLTKLGGNTLTLDRANTYAGATRINDGVLKSGVNNALPAGTVLSLGSGVTGGSLNLDTFDHTVASLAVNSTAAANNPLVVGSGKTLTISGNVTVGLNSANAVTQLAASGGGNLVVGTGATNTFQVGGTTLALLAGNTAVDLSGLASFTLNYGAGGNPPGGRCEYGFQ